MVGILAAAAPLADPDPPQAKATTLPCIGLSPAGVVGDALNIGNPVGDACDAVTDPILGAASDAVLGPLKDAASSIGKGVFNKVTTWIADGSVWLLGEVAALAERTTSPDLLGKGFLRQYRLMTQIAALMAALMVIFAVLDALGKGEPSLIWRVLFVNVPLAAIATSAAFVVAQLLIATCDGMCVAIASSTGADAKSFFKGAITAIAAVGGTSGAAVGAATAGGAGAAAGAVAVPLFIGFLAAVVVAFAAFFVWLELLMRDAAIYVTALFMPLAIGAAIWPRWSSALRRTCELLVVLIFSKFVIVAIIALAASLMSHSEGSVQYVLAAAAMLLLACFAPFVLFKLVPFAEGAVAAATSRQSGTAGVGRSMQSANSMMSMQRMSRANWGSATARENGGQKAGGKDPRPGSGTGAGSGAAGESAAAGGAAAGAVPVAAAAGAAKAARSGGERLGESGEAQAIDGTRRSDESRPAPSARPQSETPGRPAGAEHDQPRQGAEGGGHADPQAPRPGGGTAAEPTDGPGGEARPSGASPPRPPAEPGQGRAAGSGS
ncbi:MAG TPA: hypothetical protein VFN18_10940 [Solirubrobacterales bacterium]|nr:hypothetical protein [Solirubrobacterales bacterium]